MEFKIPKQLEKVPVVFGLPLKTVVFIVVSGLLFFFLMMTNFLVSLICPILVICYMMLNKKFKREGELLEYIKYTTDNQVILFDTPLKNIINNKLNNNENN